MQVVDNLRGVQPDRGMILTVGAYDGLHRGHQALLSKLIRHSRCSGYLSGLITFHPHPRAVLQTGYHVQYLTTPGEKAALLERMDLDTLVVLRFSQDLASMSPRDFVLSLCDHLQMRELWVGEDFALGRNREGNVHTLRALGAELGFFGCSGHLAGLFLYRWSDFRCHGTRVGVPRVHGTMVGHYTVFPDASRRPHGSGGRGDLG